jgi:hypothetical protein
MARLIAIKNYSLDSASRNRLPESHTIATTISTNKNPNQLEKAAFERCLFYE